MLTPVHRSVAFGALFWGALEAHHAIQQSDEHGIIIIAARTAAAIIGAYVLVSRIRHFRITPEPVRVHARALDPIIARTFTRSATAQTGAKATATATLRKGQPN
jgi:hypothetical protein